MKISVEEQRKRIKQLENGLREKLLEALKKYEYYELEVVVWNEFEVTVRITWGEIPAEIVYDPCDKYVNELEEDENAKALGIDIEEAYATCVEEQVKTIFRPYYLPTLKIDRTDFKLESVTKYEVYTDHFEFVTEISIEFRTIPIDEALEDIVNLTKRTLKLLFEIERFWNTIA